MEVEKDYDLIIRRGKCVTPEEIMQGDIAISDGKIACIEKIINKKAKKIIDASNKFVLPGLIDIHVHFGIPMINEWCTDDPDSGSMAAIAGGVTSVADFTIPAAGLSPLQTLEERISYFNGRTRCDYTFNCTLNSQTASDIDSIKKVVSMGVKNFKIFTCYKASGLMINPHKLAELFKLSQKIGALILIHAEDESIMMKNRKHFIAAGKKSAIFHALSRPEEAEYRAVKFCLDIAKTYGGNIHFVHISTEKAATLIAEAKSQGISVTCETCPHYLLLDSKCYRKKNGEQFIVAPPLRPAKNKKMLWMHLLNGTITAIATDHCPFYTGQKKRANSTTPFYKIPGGLPGVETSFRLMYSYGVKTGKITLQELVRLMSTNPAKILGIYPRKGSLIKGADADIVIFNPRNTDTISASNLLTRSNFSPYEGLKVEGKIETVLIRGKPVIYDSKIIFDSPSGIFIPQSPGKNI